MERELAGLFGLRRGGAHRRRITRGPGGCAIRAMALRRMRRIIAHNRRLGNPAAMAVAARSHRRSQLLSRRFWASVCDWRRRHKTHREFRVANDKTRVERFAALGKDLL